MFTQLAAGIFGLSLLAQQRQLLPAQGVLPLALTALAVGLALVGLVASVFHLGRPLGAWRALLHARTARDVADAFAGWVDPVNRVLTADSTGDVLSLTAGKVPAVPAGAPELALPTAKPADGYVELPAPAPVTDFSCRTRSTSRRARARPCCRIRCAKYASCPTPRVRHSITGDKAFTCAHC